MEYDEPNTREVSLGIIPPPNSDFELTTSMLCIVERSTFKGSSIECPLQHLDRFERNCRLFRMNGIPEDTVRMMLFPFSLENKGAYWEKTVPSNQVSTWGDVRMEFIRKFFPKEKTAKFRIDIQCFMQMEEESLSDAWDRLKWYTSSCPHHGISKENLLWIFYQGVLDEIREALDNASYGSFANLNVEQAEQLIEDLAQNDAWYEDDYDNTQASFQQGDFQLEGDTPSQPSQDLDIKTMLQMIMEGQVRKGQEMKQELQMEDPLEITLVVEKGEHEFLSEENNGVENMLDESKDMVVDECLKLKVTELPENEERTKENLEGSVHDESWSELKSPKLELKPLPKEIRMPFEPFNAPTNFQRSTTFIFSDFIEGVVDGSMDEFYVYGSLFGASLLNLCKVSWWLSLLLLALLLQTKLKLFPGDKG